MTTTIKIARRSPAAQDLADTITLKELRDRLTEIIDENDRRGWSERNNQPVVCTVPQPKTATGRLRPDVWVPVRYACSAKYSIPLDGTGRASVTELRAPMGYADRCDR